ncbi:MAG: ABC transporter substrate-binding protein [Janthinobacterium lividum]
MPLSFRAIFPAMALAAALCGSAVHAATNDFKGKTFQVAINAIYPPMEYHDPASNALIGFDIDLGDALAAKMGAKIAWQESAFAQLLPSLATQRADFIISGLNDRPERRATADFVDYLNSGAQVLVQTSRVSSFPNVASLCGKRIGMSRSTAFPAAIAALSDTVCVQTGKPAITIVGTEDTTAARTALKQGRVDAAVQGSETVAYTMRQEPALYQPLGTPFAPRPQGIAFRKSDTALRNAVGIALRDLMQDGTYTRLINKWHLQSSAASKVTLNDGETLP